MAHVSLNAAALASPGAVAYACTRLGFRVFPLLGGTKRPALKGWRRAATTDLRQVREWFTGEFAHCGVGIATGPESGVWVLDVDRKNGLDGFASLRELFTANNQSSDIFAKTLCVATPSGGAHLYFRWTAASGGEPGRVVPTKSGNPASGLDTRGVGGLVRAPGFDGYAIVPRAGRRDCAVVAAPEWLTELCSRTSAHVSADDHATDARPGAAASMPVMSAAKAVQYLECAAPGTRNDELNRAAFRLARAGGVTEADAWEQCRTVLYSIGANDPVEAQRRTFESGWNAGIVQRGSVNTHSPDATARTATTEG